MIHSHLDFYQVHLTFWFIDFTLLIVSTKEENTVRHQHVVTGVLLRLTLIELCVERELFYSESLSLNRKQYILGKFDSTNWY